MTLTFQLRYSESRQRPATAWLLPGSHPDDWLRELTAWGVPLAKATLHVVPNADRPGEQLGALVLLPSGDDVKCVRAAAFGELAPGLLVPVEAVCDPPATADELCEQLPGELQDAFYLWHPIAGLQRLDRNAGVSMARFVTPPRKVDREWNRALPGVAVQQRLLSIEPLVRPTAAEVIKSAGGDIGSQPLKGQPLPQAPGEPMGGVVGRAIASAGLNAASLAAGAVSAVAGAIGAGSSALLGTLAGGILRKAAQGQKSDGQKQGRLSWLAGLAEWARRQREAAQKHLDLLRNRQIERLLHALSQSPDEGLKYAIPLNTNNHRGLGTPHAHLVERDVDFSMGGLAGGRAVDPWQLSADQQRRLMQQYRELANRELSLRRYRRAAYIFAELLADYSSAASALTQGGHYREAAALYEGRLHRPLTAAKCLEQGGLLVEAIALYERLEQWETVGDLYQRLERPDEAETAYRQAVDAHRRTDSHQEAARLLEEKLQAPAEAYAVLCEGWPDSPAARRCLDASFQLLARHQWHDQAVRRVGELEAAQDSQTPGHQLAGALALVAAEYPQADVRSSAAEMTRRVVSRRLSEAPAHERESLLGSLASLVPADRLLMRDCDRYLGKHKPQPRAWQASPYRRAAREINRFSLPAARWKMAVSIGSEFYAAGFHKGYLFLVRGCWDGSVQFPGPGHPWGVPAAFERRPVLLAAEARGVGPLYFHILGASLGSLVKPATFQPTATLPLPIRAGAHPAASALTSVLSYGPGASLFLGQSISDGGPSALLLRPYDDERLLPGSHTIRLDSVPDLVADEGNEPPPLPFFSRGADLYVGCGRML
jgi:hypothetical protein